MTSILLIDDHEIVRRGLKLLINNEPDMKVLYEADNGETGVDLALKIKPDIVIMDLNMPKINGLLAMKQINEVDESIKMIVLTMHDDEEYKYRAFEAGAASYVLKQHQDSNLIDAIRIVHKGHFSYLTKETKALLNNNNKSLGYTVNCLTAREQEVLSHIATGYTNREIAEKMYLSIKTIEAHRANIMKKLNFNTRSDLVKYALKHGYLEGVY